MVDDEEDLSRIILDPEEDEDEPPRSRRAKGDYRFSQIPLQWLADPSVGHRLFGARERVWIWLWYRSFGGEKTVRFNNEAAEALGLPRTNKMRELRWLEARGLVTLAAIGSRTVIVTVHVPACNADDAALRQE
jgi:hypothetical protein